MSRHTWNPSKEGYLKCAACDLEVKAYRVKRGGLPPCNPKLEEKHVEDSKSTLVQCPHCQMTVPNTVTCLYCGSQLHPLNYNPDSGRLPP